MTKRVLYVTTARSDYGPSYWLLHDLFSDPRFSPFLVVGGSHLSQAHGLTVREIERDGFPIAARLPFLEVGDDNVSHARSAAHALGGFAGVIAESRPDLVVLYGDRYELLPIATAAVVTRTPIAHVCGGDVTEGAMDEQVRHAVTKMAHIHFASTKRSAQRILQMGEERWRVHEVGDPALDHFVRGESASVEELTDFLGFRPDRSSLLVTFHPVTLEESDIPRQAAEIAAALQEYPGPVVITAPAPDPGGEVIRLAMQRLVASRPKARFVENLGSRRYHGILRVVGAMVGNSSSGMNEAPCALLPVVNIGRRQMGRERARNVIDCPAERTAIREALAIALSGQFMDGLVGLKNPYGDGRASRRITDVLGSLPPRERLLGKKFAEP